MMFFVSDMLAPDMHPDSLAPRISLWPGSDTGHTYVELPSGGVVRTVLQSSSLSQPNLKESP
jgi:hypothetical protein